MSLALDGRNLETIRLGPAGEPVLVFLHEGLGSAGLWRDFPEKLARATGLSAFIYSRAGYGKSDPAPLPRPVRYMHDEAALLPRLLAAAGIRDPLLVGHSDGASIALLYAGEGHPARGLILEAPHVFAEEEGLRSIARMRQQYLDTDLRARLGRWHAHVDAAFYGWNDPWLHPDFRRWNIEGSLPRITAPMLLVQGLDDEYGTRRQLDAISAGAGGSVETLLLPGCGHAPHREKPEETLQAMARFVASVT